MITLELAGYNPAVSKEIRSVCTFTEISVAWMAKQRTTRNVGYRVE